MPRLRTDDGPRKLRAVWLGPAGATLPFQWTYVQWAVTLVAMAVMATAGTGIVWLMTHDPAWALFLGGLWGGAGGVYFAVRVMRNVTYDEPLSYQRRLLKTEFSRQLSQPVGPREIAVEFSPPPICYLAPAIRRSMGWDLAAQQPLAPVSDLADNAQEAQETDHLEPEDPTSALPDPDRPRNPYLITRP